MRTITGLINRFTDRDLNILTCPTHERYQSGFEDIDATFHMIQFNNIKPWNYNFGKLPKNHILWPRDYFPSGIRFDAVLSQNKFGQYQLLSPIARDLNIPIISLEHTLPVPSWNNDIRQSMLSMTGVVNVFISDFSRREWGFDKIPNSVVINHMVDSDVFKPKGKRENKVLSVVNDYKNRDWCCNYSAYEYINIKVGGDKFTLVGDNPGLSEPAKSTEELAYFYAGHRIFLNTSKISPIPTALLEAMASGCAVVSTATCMIPEVIENGVNGFMSNDYNELAEFIQLLLSDENLAASMGQKARETILNKFNKKEFVKNWSSIINKVCV